MVKSIDYLARSIIIIPIFAGHENYCTLHNNHSALIYAQYYHIGTSNPIIKTVAIYALYYFCL